MVRRRAAITDGETREKKTGSSLYSRQTTIHIPTPWRRMTAGSTRSKRALSHSCRTRSCSRTGGSAGGISAAPARAAASKSAAVQTCLTNCLSTQRSQRLAENG
jgi:hypothetical protein